MKIAYTQFMLPDGEKVQRSINRPDKIGEQAKIIVAKGYRLEAEVLRTGVVSFTIYDPVKDYDVCIELSDNGPAVGAAFDKLIKSFDACVKEGE